MIYVIVFWKETLLVGYMYSLNWTTGLTFDQKIMTTYVRIGLLARTIKAVAGSLKYYFLFP